MKEKWDKLEVGDECPVCKETGELEGLVNDEGLLVKDRCPKGCFVFNSTTMNREK